MSHFFRVYYTQIKLFTFFLYSKFSEIYDEDHFIQRLKNDVRVVDKVPEFIMERFGHNLSNAFNFKIKAWSPIQFYEDVVLPKLIEERWVETNDDCSSEEHLLFCDIAK